MMDGRAEKNDKTVIGGVYLEDEGSGGELIGGEGQITDGWMRQVEKGEVSVLEGRKCLRNRKSKTSVV